MARKAELLSPLGALYYNTGRYEEALQVYREAAALQPSQRELRLALVSAWAKERREHAVCGAGSWVRASELATRAPQWIHFLNIRITSVGAIYQRHRH